jgi:methylglutaconyl-CoA hydratase
MKDTSVRYEIQDGVGLITLARPAKANAFHGGLIQELIEILDHLDQDPGVRLLLLRGEGKHFCSGADLEWMKESAVKSHQENLDDAKILQDLFYRWYRFRAPTIAVVQGAVYGGGLGLLAASDVGIAYDSARFCLSEVRLGLLPSVIFPFLAQKMALGSIKRLGLTGAPFNPDKALEYGLVDLVCKESDGPQVIHQEVNNILAGAPGAQMIFKKIFSEQPLFSLNDLSWREKIATARSSEEAKEGLGAFFEKRPPSYEKKAHSL